MLGMLLEPTRWFWGGNLEALVGIRFRKPPIICNSSYLSRIRTCIFEDGYVVLETKNRKRAVDCCNALLFSLTLLTGTSSEPVTSRSLENVTVKSGERHLTGKNSLCQLRNFFSVYEEIRKEWEVELMGRVFDTQELPIVFEFANRILRFHNPALATRHLAASYHFVKGNWTASLLLGWTIIEQVLDEELIIRYSSKGMSRESAERKVSRMKEESVILELMKPPHLRIGAPDPTVLDNHKLMRIDRLRRLRNDVVHRGLLATCGHAKRMKWGSQTATWRLLRQHGFEYNTYLNRITPIQEERNRRLWGDSVRFSEPKRKPCAELGS